MEFSRKPAIKVLSLLSILTVAGCGGLYTDYDTDKKNIDPIDRPGGLTRKEYIDSLMPKPEEKEVKIETKEPPLPKVSEMVLTPPKPKLGINKTVSLSVTEDVQLKDVFIELARLADIDIEVDPSIQGGVIFKAKNRPFDEVVERITDLAGLRYSVNNGVLRIERDKAYIENYTVDFLNIVRSNTGSVQVNTKVLSSSVGGGNSGGGSGGSGGSSGGSSGSTNSGAGGSSSSSDSGLSTGSTASITSTYNGDLWTSVQADINAIIGSDTAASQASAGTAAGGRSNNDMKSFVSVNRQAGMVTVSTTAKNHAKIKEYLKKVGDYASAQVLIEAKIIEVALDDQYKSGIDWSLIGTKGLLKGVTASLGADAVASSSSPLAPVSSIGLVKAGGNITTAVQLAQAFGTTRTLSSPRILVLNNQQAVLSFATNTVYFTLDINNQTATSTGVGAGTTSNKTVQSTVNTIPIGVIMTLQPAINTETNEIIMNIRPTLSRLSGPGKEDPAVALSIDQGSSSTPISSVIPEVEVREMDSVLKIKSGQIMAIGGMIEQRSQNTDTGIPYASDIPVVGNLFKGTDKQTKSVQTIIFLKATIVPGYGVENPDQNIYNKFNNDPRPLLF